MDKIVRVPANADEMTLQQLMNLLGGNVQGLLEMSDEELENADLDDLQQVIDAWNKIPLMPTAPFDTITGYDQRFVLKSILQDWKVGERMVFDEALKEPLKNLHILIALHTRPALTKYQAITSMKKQGATMKQMFRVATNGEKWLPKAFDKKELHDRAELFLQTMTAGQALYICTYFTILAGEYLKQELAETA